jgi:hypothetical protein
VKSGTDLSGTQSAGCGLGHHRPSVSNLRTSWSLPVGGGGANGASHLHGMHQATLQAAEALTVMRSVWMSETGSPGTACQRVQKSKGQLHVLAGLRVADSDFACASDVAEQISDA